MIAVTVACHLLVQICGYGMWTVQKHACIFTRPVLQRLEENRQKSPSSTDDLLADDTNTFHGLRNPIAVEPVSKLGHALRKLRVFEWLKSWTLMMLDWPKSWAPMMIDWTKTDPARIALDPVPSPAPLAAAAGIRTTAPAPAASRAGALVFGLEFKLVLGAAVTGSAPRFAGFPGF